MSQRADCKDCKNRINRPYRESRDYTGRCRYDMRWASTAGGSEPADLNDVYRCRDYEEDAEEFEE